MNAEKVGQLIQKKRIEKHLTQEELANKLYVSNKTISKWENGRGVPSIELLMPICEALNMELKELLTGEQEYSYEELLVQELKKKKRRNIATLVGGIILALLLCFLEVILYMTNIREEVATIIFIVFILLLLIIDICYYFIYQK